MAYVTPTKPKIQRRPDIVKQLPFSSGGLVWLSSHSDDSTQLHVCVCASPIFLYKLQKQQERKETWKWMKILLAAGIRKIPRNNRVMLPWRQNMQMAASHSGKRSKFTRELLARPNSCFQCDYEAQSHFSNHKQIWARRRGSETPSAWRVKRTATWIWREGYEEGRTGVELILKNDQMMTAESTERPTNPRK